MHIGRVTEAVAVDLAPKNAVHVLRFQVFGLICRISTKWVGKLLIMKGFNIHHLRTWSPR